MTSISTIHHNLPRIVSKSILKSFIGSLNATAIAYARGHLRYNALENVASRMGDRIPTIDDRNDADAAIAEAHQRNTFAGDQGGVIQMQSGELADRIMGMRNYFADLLEQMKEQANDVPLTIAETVQFQLDRPAENNDALVEALALAVDIDPEVLKAAKLKMTTDDATDLRANAGKIISYLESFGGQHFSDDQAEENFDALPAHVQFKFYGAVLRGYDKASEKAMISLLRGKIDAAGDIKMLKAVKAELQNDLRIFSKKHRIELDAYIERGGSLPSIDDHEIVVENTRKASDNAIVGARAIANDAAQARIDEDNAKLSKMKRVPKAKTV